MNITIRLREWLVGILLYNPSQIHFSDETLGLASLLKFKTQKHFTLIAIFRLKGTFSSIF